MKKISSLLVVTVSLFLTSCLGSSDPFENEVTRGQYLYSYVGVQNFMVGDISEMVFKLNILLETAAAQPEAETLEDVTVQIGGVNKKLMTEFFGTGKVVKGEGDIYEIRYTDSDYPLSGNINRNGTIKINTHGKTLSQFEESGDYWSMDDPTEGYKVISGNDKYSSTFTQLMVNYSGPGAWIMQGGSNLKMAGDDSKSWDWSINYKISQSGTNGMGYNDVVNSNNTFEKSGESTGKNYILGVAMTYLIPAEAPLKFRPSCSTEGYYPVSGVERVEIAYGAWLDNETLQVEYPSRDVKYLYQEIPTGSCQPSVSISYNGYTYSNGTITEED